MTASVARLALSLNSVAGTLPGDTMWPGGRGSLSVEATWGGGNVVFQRKSINGTWIAVDATLGTLTQNGIVNFELPPCELRVVITTATAVYAYVEGTYVS